MEKAILMTSSTFKNLMYLIRKKGIIPSTFIYLYAPNCIACQLEDYHVSFKVDIY